MPKIKFRYLNEYAHEVCERPRPAKYFVPEWFKKMDPYDKGPKNPNGDKLIVENLFSNASAKKCMPMLDGMTAGYIVPLWADVQIQQTDYGPNITWRVTKDVFRLHGPSGREIPPPPGYDPIVFKFETYMQIITPPGYSLIVKPIAGHYQQPIVPLSAIVDTDTNVIDNNFPCWIKSGFEGIIEKGTPIAQVIPFKREAWDSEVDYISEEQFNYQLEKGALSKIADNYIKKLWSKKEYK
jgi:hypothetical protein